MKGNQRPYRRAQRAVRIQPSQGAVREFGSHALVPKKMNLSVEPDAPGERFARVMQEGRPAYRGAGRCLAYHPDRMLPKVLLATTPWSEVYLRLSHEWLELGERNAQQVGAAQRVESVIDVLAKQ